METREFEAAQEFLLAAKNYWTTTMYRTIKATYAELEAGLKESSERPTKATEALQKNTLYRYFAWLERHLQRMKYSGRYGLVPFHSERRSDLLKDIIAKHQDKFSPELQPDLALPNYYKNTDIHQHPGDLWSDEIAGVVYEFGARSTTPLLGNSHDDLHSRFTSLLADGSSYDQILDMGCGFGKSTMPFVQRFPSAHIEGIDLSAPCLLLGAQRARQAKHKNVHYEQMNAEQTSYEDESFDLVTSTMLLHEIPTKAIKNLFDEAFRVLRPGGRMAHLDFHVIPDEFHRLLHYGHSVRNNEPFMRGLAELDLKKVLSEKGFENVELSQFAESENAHPKANDAWRFPWTVISATKPAD